MRWPVMFCALFVLVLMYTPVAHAQASSTSPDGGRVKISPLRQEMIVACANKSKGAPCSFSREGQTVKGTCNVDIVAQRLGGTGKQLTCFSRQGQAIPGALIHSTPEANVPQQ
jgi:hypothetical protein